MNAPAGTKVPVSLVIFDVDGTLVEKFTSTLRPGVADWFEANKQMKVAWGIATNQGGVGFRLHKEHQGIKPEPHPTETQVRDRIGRVLGQLPVPFYHVEMAFRWVWTNGTAGPKPDNATHEWSVEMRKPAGGMLRRICTEAGIHPRLAVYIGDQGKDWKAAQSAGVHFVHIDLLLDGGVELVEAVDV